MIRKGLSQINKEISSETFPRLYLSLGFKNVGQWKFNHFCENGQRGKTEIWGIKLMNRLF